MTRDFEVQVVELNSVVRANLNEFRARVFLDKFLEIEIESTELAYLISEWR